jgi:uncharacterized DUF497 family protein
MYNHIVRFEWDYEKADSNEREHKISFIEAATAFDDDLAVALPDPDPDHSMDEFRLLILGESSRGRLLVVSYTDRDDLIRIISARIPTRSEQHDYENR